MFKKITLRQKLLVTILPLIVLGLVILVLVSYKNSKTSIEAKTETLLKSESTTSANAVEAWMNENLGILNTAVITMENLNMDDEAILNYEGFYLETYDDFPNGVYVCCDNGKVLDATGWEPEGDVREKDYYIEGKEHPVMTFGAPYLDDYTGGFVVTASRYSPKLKAVIATDIGLDVLSEVVSALEVEGNGDCFIIDINERVILAHKDPETQGKSVDEIDKYYSDVIAYIESGNEEAVSINAAGGKYMTSYANVEGTNFYVVTRAPESVIFKDVKKIGRILIYLGIILVALLTFVLVFILNLATKPIEKLTDAIVAVTNGDFTTDIEVTTKDEIGEMAAHMKTYLQVMRDTMGTIINISEVIDNQAQGNNRISGELNDSAEGQIDAMEQLMDNLKQLVESVNMIAEDATNLANVVAETTTQGEDAISNIESTMDAAGQGKDNMNNVANSMILVKDGMAELEKSINNVGDAAVKIDEITSTISAIADETNLLALNASIEAARAGEAGRGFAVVATQIKSLAETSGSAAEEISELISNVTALIGGTVEQSQKSIVQINESAELITDASDQFNQIYESIEETSNLIHDIIGQIRVASDVASNMAAITEEQSASATEIENTAINMQELADTVSKNSFTVKNESDELATTATDLKDKISMFTIE